MTLSEPHQQFLAWVKAILNNEDNFARFKQLYRPPISTNELTEAIFSEFEKVFEAQNSFEKFEFTDNELENDFKAYRKKIGDFTYWETQGFEAFKNSIDNVLVIDLPSFMEDEQGNRAQASDRPEPYYYILDIDNIIDICNERIETQDPTNKEFYYFKCEYLIFKGDKEEDIFVFDDTYFRKYKRGENNADPVLQTEIAHNLGYTPARSFWTTPLNSKSKVQKRSPLTNSLSELDWYLFFSVAQKYLELYAPFPIYAIYRSKCTYAEVGSKTNRKCENGFLISPGQRPGPTTQRCPSCSEKLKVGPGNVMLIDVPKDKSEDPDLMVNPMKVIPAETTSLEYVKDRLATLWDRLYSNCVGKGTDTMSTQAVNELQIQAGFETRTSVLLKTKRNFEIIHQFALETICRLRYGESFLTATVNYGDEFFATDATGEIAEYKEAVANGLPSYELASRREAIYNTLYRNDPDKLQRLNILRNLEPFPDNNVTQLQAIRKDAPEIVPIEQLVLKLNFNAFIDRFEREQANILLFANKQNFDKKITAIQSVLLQYAKDYLQAGKVIEEVKPPTPAPDALPVA